MRRVLIVVGIAAVLLLSGCLLFKHFVTDQIMDGGDMRNPDYTYDPDDIEELDGDGTYVDNQALMDVITGTWRSLDGSYALLLSEEYRAVLSLGDETVLDSGFRFTYPQPGVVTHTDFKLDTRTLEKDGESAYAEIEYFYHELNDGVESLHILAHDTNGAELNIEFTKN